MNASAVQAAGLPGGSLLLGLAEDGLPVLLDLYDPAPGPLLVAGDGGSGKTAFLQSLARAAGLQDSSDIQFGVITPFPEEWISLEFRGLNVWVSGRPIIRPPKHSFPGWSVGRKRFPERARQSFCSSMGSTWYLVTLLRSCTTCVGCC